MRTWRLHFAFVAIGVGLLAAACSDPAPTSTPIPDPTSTPTLASAVTPTPASASTPTLAPAATPTPAPASTPTLAPTSTPTPASSIEELTPILGTTVLRIGTQRVAFLLESATALVSAPEASVRTTFLDGDAQSESTTAVFDLWPFGTRGSYVTDLTFPQVGRWRLDIAVDDASVVGEAELLVEVEETSIVRDIGQIALFSNTKTVETVQGDLTKLTSDYRPDAELYELSIAESIFSGRPSVVVFASPAFCTTPTCGPQVQTLSELKDSNPDAADYIHVEIYDNPHEIQGDLSRGVLSPVLAEWGVDQVPHYRNESWTFVIGADGRIDSRFEGYVSLAELESALAAVLSEA